MRDPQRLALVVVLALLVVAVALRVANCHGSGTPASGSPMPQTISPAIQGDLNHGRP